MLSAVCLGVVLQSQTVSLEMPAARLDRVLDKIGAQVGQKLRCSDQFLDDYLVVSFKDRPLDEVMSQIASAVDGRWRPGDGGGIIAAEAALDKKREAAQVAERTEYFAKELASLQALGKASYDSGYVISMFDAVDKALALPETDERRNQILAPYEYQSPGRRLQSAIYQMIGAKTLAELPLNTRVVFSTNPTSLQRPLDPAIFGLIKRYEQEKGLVRTVSRGRKLPDFLPYPLDSFGLNPNGSDDGTAGEASLVWASLYTSSFGFSLMLSGWDAKGEQVNLANTSMQFPLSGPFRFSELKADWVPEDAIHEWSAGANDWSKWLADRYGSAENLSAPSELVRQALFRPEERDYLSFAPSEAWLAAARAANRSLAVVLTDGDANIGAEGKTVKLREYIESLVAYPRSEMWDKDGWVISRPVDLDAARLERISRQGVAEFLQAQNPQESIPAERTLNLVAHCNSRQSVSATVNIAYFGLGAHSFLSAYDCNEAVILAANLDAPHRRTLLLNGTVKVPVSSLSARAKKIANDMLFGNMLFSTLDAEPDQPGFRLGGVSFSTQDPTYEPTYTMTLPNLGPPSVVITYQNLDAFSYRNRTNNDNISQLLSLDEVAQNAAELQEALARGDTEAYVRDLVYSHQPVGYFAVSFIYADKYEAKARGYVSLRPQVQNFTTIEGLKGSFRKTLDERIKTASDTRKGYQYGDPE